MLRELAITIYLFIFKFIFFICKQMSLRNKTTLVASFGDNLLEIMKALNHDFPEHNVVILKTNSCKINFESHKNNVFYFESKNIIHVIKSIYHLATSSHIIVDNYYGFLATTKFKKKVNCIQVWHAAGAVKHFGLEDQSNIDRSSRAMKRFQAVYNRFDNVVIGSDQMIDIFKRSFGLSEDRFVKTGIPRTDFFYNENAKRNSIHSLKQRFPIIKDKKVILYAPTYRDNELFNTNIQLDIKKLYETFKYKYIILLRLHPAVSDNFENKYPGFVHNVSGYHSVNELLTITDVLITDYSSIPFEYSILNRPMIFYSYDFNTYMKQRGVWKDYIDKVPGPVVYSTEEIVHVLQTEDFKIEKVKPFAETWNKYSNGNATNNFIDHFYR